MPKKLFVWLEGYYDQRFFEEIVEPLLRDRYASIHTNVYAERPEEETRKKVHGVTNSQAILDYLWVTDLDPKKFPCITARKSTATRQFRLLQPNRIVVVVPEIEAWYLAGLDSATCSVLGIPDYQNTNVLTKEKFREIIPRTYKSEIDFRMEILSCFSVEAAIRKNASFAYFFRKHLQVI